MSNASNNSMVTGMVCVKDACVKNVPVSKPRQRAVTTDHGVQILSLLLPFSTTKQSLTERDLRRWSMQCTEYAGNGQAA